MLHLLTADSAVKDALRRASKLKKGTSKTVTWAKNALDLTEQELEEINTTLVNLKKRREEVMQEGTKATTDLAKARNTEAMLESALGDFLRVLDRLEGAYEDGDND
jgi:hypothetical protein